MKTDTSWTKVVSLQLVIMVCLFLVGDFVYSNLTKGQQIRVPHDVYHHTLFPSVQTTELWGPNSYRICTDANGFKSACESVSAQQRTFDFAFIGDSFTEGIGLPYEDTFVGMFSSHYPELAVANLGVSSYSPTIYVSKIKYLLDQGFSFDHVYVFIDISDIQDESVYSRDASGSVRSADDDAGVREKRSFLVANFSLTYLGYRFLRGFLSEEEKTNERGIAAVTNLDRSLWTVNQEVSGYGEGGVAEALEKAVLEMESLHELLELNGIKLSVGVYPWPDQLLEITGSSGEENLQSKTWRAFCERKCENFTDMFRIYEGLLHSSGPAGVYESYFIPGDVHYNRDGNRLIFEELVSAGIG